MRPIREKVLGKDLPKEWQQKINARPDELVLVIIQSLDENTDYQFLQENESPKKT